MALDPLHIPRDTLRAVGFLSRVPVPDIVFRHDGGDLAHVSRTFPLAGVLIALPAAAVMTVCLWLGASTLLAAALAVTALVVTTGGLHEDGMADTADGFFARGSLEDRLRIMKDPLNGTFATLALVLGQTVRVAALAAVAGAGPWHGAFAVLAAAALSRAAMAEHWSALPPARAGGLASSFGQPGRMSASIGFALTAGLAVLATALPGIHPLSMTAALGALAAADLAFGALVRRKIGGQTGDTVGAAQQISEIAFLSALALAL